MRLIDADDLIEFLESVTVTDGITFKTGFKQIITDIKNQPTIAPIQVLVEEMKKIGTNNLCMDIGDCSIRIEVEKAEEEKYE